VQVLTKSGGNEFHGSGVWSLLNTGLDANEWNRNRQGLGPDYKNVNQYTISAGGPIVKNKTFFFATWDQNIVLQRLQITPGVLTPCARKGIYRWFPGWINGDADVLISRNAGTQVRPVVNPDGTPLTPTDNRDGTPYTGTLQWASVLGQLTPQAQAQIAADPINCSKYNFTASDTGIVAGSNWDPYRKSYDPTGYIDRFSAMMPLPNYYYNGDGLNVAALSRTRRTKGMDTVYGTGYDNLRKSITFKIDHNINAKQRLSGTYSYESDSTTGASSWPNGFGGAGGIRKPQTFTSTLTSTLKPTLLNEFRFGLAYNDSHTMAPFDNPATGEELKALLQTLLPTDSFADWKGLPVAIFPGIGTSRFQPGLAAASSHPMGGAGPSDSTWGSQDYRWTFSDTVSWTKGSHSFKVGGDVRLTKANADMNGWGQFEPPVGPGSANWHPIVFGGNTVNSQPTGLTAASAQWPGLVGLDRGNTATGSYGQIYDLMNYMAGSVSAVRQFYFVNDAFAGAWSDPSTPEGQTRYLRMNQREFSVFFKDDWKVNSGLTLNLGMRYEYYGMPWMLNGLTVGLAGGAQSIFGGSEGGFSTWLREVPPFNPGNLTTQQFIGPGSPNPDQQLFNKDLNNFGPAVGFAWQLPWFGQGKTTLRGGYQVSYTLISRLDPNSGFMNVAGSQPGLLYPHFYSGDTATNKYLDLSMLQNLVPTSKFWDGTVQPLQIRPVTDGTQSVAVYDPNIRSPYIQSLTMALTRQVGSSLTLDVRYIGTLSRKQVSTINLNTNNWISNGLKDAFDSARAGGESDLLNRMIPPNSLVANTASGAAQLRAYTLTSTNLATGNYNAIASTLATTNGRIPSGPNIQGNLLRIPENFIRTNPQFAAANVWGNNDYTNYHSMQAQFTLRPMHGLNFQTTYTWSRNLGVSGAATDPLDRAADYGILSNHRSHMLSTYGTYNLPFGPTGYLFRKSSGFLNKVAEGWQMSWASSITSGLPASVTAVESMWANALPDLVRPDLFDSKEGTFTWSGPDARGRFFGDKYVQVDDPQCNSVAASLQNACRTSLNALALASDPSVIVFQNPKPGVRGNFLPNQLTGPGRWSLDMAMSKNIEFMEGKSINIRVDVNNIFNHPTPSGTAPTSYNARDYRFFNPNFNLNSSDPFGYIGFKGGHRVLSAKLRITF
jgi:hypothetical protein